MLLSVRGRRHPRASKLKPCRAWRKHRDWLKEAIIEPPRRSPDQPSTWRRARCSTPGADLLVELAEVLRTADHRRASREAVDESARLYERNGNIVVAGRVTQVAGNDPSPSASPKQARTMVSTSERSDSHGDQMVTQAATNGL